MDFEASNEQQAVLEAVGTLLERHAGPARAIELAKTNAYDFELDRALAEGGFVDIARTMSPLEAAMVAEAVAAAGGRTAYTTAALVAANVLEGEIDGPIAVAHANEDGPVRYGAHARHLLIIDGRASRIATLEAGTIAPLPSNFGYPMGYISRADRASGEPIPEDKAETLANWSRLALAVEATGTMHSALGVTVEYLKTRRQFGRTIGSFQAVQHRLAECFVLIEASRWMIYECAALGAPRESAATVAAHTLAGAARVFTEMHQLSGAIGFTHEHDLHVWSMRLHALRTELGGVAGHRRRISHARWGSTAS